MEITIQIKQTLLFYPFMSFVINVDNDTTIARYCDDFKQEFLFFPQKVCQRNIIKGSITRSTRACMHEA